MLGKVSVVMFYLVAAGYYTVSLYHACIDIIVSVQQEQNYQQCIGTEKKGEEK